MPAFGSPDTTPVPQRKSRSRSPPGAEASPCTTAFVPAVVFGMVVHGYTNAKSCILAAVHC